MKEEDRLCLGVWYGDLTGGGPSVEAVERMFLKTCAEGYRARDQKGPITVPDLTCGRERGRGIGL